MKQKSFEFRVREIEVGWCDVVMTINGKAIPYNASYLGVEPLASMIEICAELMQESHVDGEYHTSWADEPGSLHLSFIPNGNGILHIDIFDEITKEEWHEGIPFDDFVSAIVSEGFRVLDALGLYGYHAAWADHTEFPISSFLLICRQYDMEGICYFDYTSNLAKEVEFLQQHFKRERIDSATVMDACTLYYDAWQMQCCGEPFSVGDKVSFTCIVPSHPFSIHGTIYDLQEEHHGDETHIVTGIVKRIQVEQSDTPKGKKEIDYNKISTDKRKVQCADGIIEELEDDTKVRTLWGYIVDLEKVIVKPLKEKR